MSSTDKTTTNSVDKNNFYSHGTSFDMFDIVNAPHRQNGKRYYLSPTRKEPISISGSSDMSPKPADQFNECFTYFGLPMELGLYTTFFLFIYFFFISTISLT